MKKLFFGLAQHLRKPIHMLKLLLCAKKTFNAVNRVVNNHNCPMNLSIITVCKTIEKIFGWSHFPLIIFKF